MTETRIPGGASGILWAPPGWRATADVTIATDASLNPETNAAAWAALGEAGASLKLWYGPFDNVDALGADAAEVFAIRSGIDRALAEFNPPPGVLFTVLTDSAPAIERLMGQCKIRRDSDRAAIWDIQRRLEGAGAAMLIRHVRSHQHGKALQHRPARMNKLVDVAARSVRLAIDASIMLRDLERECGES